MDTNHQKANILLVDDRPENLLALESLLEDSDRVFLKAESGNEALKIVLQHDFALILLDVQMPEMNGFEVAELLRMNPKTKHIPIIFVTAISKEEEYVVKGLESGAMDYLYKPLNPDITRMKVRAFLEMYYQRREIEDKNKELDYINKELDQFAYIVAHDLKAPLRGLYHIADFIEDDLRDVINGPMPEGLQENLMLMRERTKKMTDLIEGILNYALAGRKKGTPEPVPTGELVDEIAELLSPPPEFSYHREGEFPTVQADRSAISQVFSNLMSNALKYHDRQDGNVWIGVEPEGNFHRFYVKDDGPGIPEEHHEKIFGIFSRVYDSERKVEGTGIGLSVVRKIVREYGGNIWVESTPGQGSTFYFTWPKE